VDGRVLVTLATFAVAAAIAFGVFVVLEQRAGTSSSRGRAMFALGLALAATMAIIAAIAQS
jgi:threonine/homoserine efflux transporter RhtA